MKVLKSLLSIIGILILSLFAYVLLRYLSWEKEFFRENKNVVCTNDEDYGEQNINIEDRIENFVLSENRLEFMTFSKKEMLFLLTETVQSNEDVKAQDICLLSGKDVWKIYFHFRIGRIQLPWVGIDIIKDNRESVELYSRSMYLGDMKIPDTLAKKALDYVNKGISDAMLLVIENNFLGKTIQNIDLLEDSIVFKGSL